MKLHCERWGTSGPVLVILHGFLGSSVNWRSVGKRWAESCTVFAVDQRNHGRSPHSMTHSYPALAGDVVELLDDYGVASAFVLGHSMGGKTAMVLAANHSDRIRGLIVVDIAPDTGGGGELREILDAMLAADPASATSRAEVDLRLARRIADPRVRAFITMNLARDPDGGMRWRLGLDELASSFDAIVSPVSLGRGYSGPTLFVRGGESGYVRDADLDVIARWFPMSRIVTIANAGHWVHVEAADELIAEVAAFVRREAKAA